MPSDQPYCPEMSFEPPRMPPPPPPPPPVPLPEVSVDAGNNEEREDGRTESGATVNVDADLSRAGRAQVGR